MQLHRALGWPTLTYKPLESSALSYHMSFTPRLTSHVTPGSVALQAFKGRTSKAPPAARTLPKAKPEAKPLPKAKSKPGPAKTPTASSSKPVGKESKPSKLGAVSTDASLSELDAVSQLADADTSQSASASSSPDSTLPGAQLQVSESEPGAEDPFNEEDEEVFPQMVLDLPLPSHSRVRTAAYVKSSVKHTQCPAANMAEFAVIGRSNVGKSSLINLLTSSKNLALVSKEPGESRFSGS